MDVLLTHLAMASAIFFDILSRDVVVEEDDDDDAITLPHAESHSLSLWKNKGVGEGKAHTEHRVGGGRSGVEYFIHESICTSM